MSLAWLSTAAWYTGPRVLPDTGRAGKWWKRAWTTPARQWPWIAHPIKCATLKLLHPSFDPLALFTHHQARAVLLQLSPSLPSWRVPHRLFKPIQQHPRALPFQTISHLRPRGLEMVRRLKDVCHTNCQDKDWFGLRSVFRAHGRWKDILFGCPQCRDCLTGEGRVCQKNVITTTASWVCCTGNVGKEGGTSVHCILQWFS